MWIVSKYSFHDFSAKHTPSATLTCILSQSSRYEYHKNGYIMPTINTWITKQFSINKFSIKDGFPG